MPPKDPSRRRSTMNADDVTAAKDAAAKHQAKSKSAAAAAPGEVWEVPHYCFVSSHDGSPALKSSAMTLTLKDSGEYIEAKKKKNDDQPKGGGNVISILAKPGAPNAEFEFHDILECGLTNTPRGGRLGGVASSLPGSPSINELAIDCVQDLLKGYHSSILGFCQVTSANGESTKVTNSTLTPTIDFLYGSNAGFFSTVSKYLFDSLEKGHGPATDVIDLLTGGSGILADSNVSGTTATPPKGKGATSPPPPTGGSKKVDTTKWNFVVEVQFLEFFQEDWTDLLLIPGDPKFATMLRKRSMRRNGGVNTKKGTSAAPSHQDPTPQPQSSSPKPHSMSATGAFKDGDGTPKGPKEASIKEEGSLAGYDDGQMIELSDVQHVQSQNVFGALGGNPDEQDSTREGTPINDDEAEPTTAADLKSSPSTSKSFSKKPTVSAPTLKLRRDPELGPFIDGAQSIMVNSAQDLLSVVSGGIGRRHDTNNKINSFSHTIMKISIRQTAIGSDQCLTSVLTLADINTLERMAGNHAGAKGGSSAAKAAFQRARRAVASSLAFRRLIQQTQAPPATNPTAEVQLNSICKDSQMTQLLSESFVGNVKTRLVSAVEVPPVPVIDQLGDGDTLVDSDDTAVLQATLTSLRLLGRRPGHLESGASIKNRIVPNIVKVQVAAQTIQMEVQRLKREMKKTDTQEDSEMKLREKEELALRIATEEGRLSGLTQQLAKKQETKEQLQQRVTKQREALNKVSEELAKKEEVLGEKERLASQVDQFLADQKQAKQQIQQDKLELSMMAHQIAEANVEIALDQSLQRRQKMELQENKHMTDDARGLHAATIFRQVLTKARAAEEEAMLTKRKKILRAKRGVLLSKTNMSNKKIEDADEEVSNDQMTADAFQSRLDSILADPSVDALTNGIRSLQQLIDLTNNQRDADHAALERVNADIIVEETEEKAISTSELVVQAQELQEAYNKLSTERSGLSSFGVNLEHQIRNLEEDAEEKEQKISLLRREAEKLIEDAATTEEAIQLLLRLSMELEATVAQAELDNTRMLSEVGYLQNEIVHAEKDIHATNRFHHGLCDVAAEKLLPV